jgi:hypothetical protein
MHMKWKIAALTATGAVVLTVALFPRIKSRLEMESTVRTQADRHAATYREISWGPEGPSLIVLGFQEVPVPPDNKPRIQMACRWKEIPTPWNRYRFTFPNSDVLYPDGQRLTPGISPLTDDGFILHYFFQEYPSAMSPMTISISLWDSVAKRDLGTRNLAMRYWPDHGEGARALWNERCITKASSHPSFASATEGGSR